MRGCGAVAVHAFGVLGSGFRHVLLTVVAAGTRAQLDDAYVIRRDVVAILASHLSLAGDGEHLALGALVALSPHRSLNVQVRRLLHDKAVLKYTSTISRLFSIIECVHRNYACRTICSEILK